MIDVVYDACALFSASQRDLLLDIAMVGLVRPHWSDEIHEEWIRSLLRNPVTISCQKITFSCLEF